MDSKHGIGTIDYKGHGTYQGQFQDNKKHGVGSWIDLNNSHTYQVKFHQDKLISMDNHNLKNHI